MGNMSKIEGLQRHALLKICFTKVEIPFLPRSPGGQVETHEKGGRELESSSFCTFSRKLAAKSVSLFGNTLNEVMYYV